MTDFAKFIFIVNLFIAVISLIPLYSAIFIKGLPLGYHFGLGLGLLTTAIINLIIYSKWREQ